MGRICGSNIICPALVKVNLSRLDLVKLDWVKLYLTPLSYIGVELSEFNLASGSVWTGWVRSESGWSIFITNKQNCLKSVFFEKNPSFLRHNPSFEVFNSEFYADFEFEVKKFFCPRILEKTRFKIFAWADSKKFYSSEFAVKFSFEIYPYVRASKITSSRIADVLKMELLRVSYYLLDKIDQF